MCQSIADSAGLGGSWMAWISDSQSSPSVRFTPAQVAYRLVDGTTVAADWTALTSGTLAHAIDHDEHAQPVINQEVWTATQSDGAHMTNMGLLTASDCQDFAWNANDMTTAAVGFTSRVDPGWTGIYQQFCYRTARLYCFEQ
jgi:hypothetical protein